MSAEADRGNVPSAQDWKLLKAAREGLTTPCDSHFVEGIQQRSPPVPDDRQPEFDLLGGSGQAPPRLTRRRTARRKSPDPRPAKPKAPGTSSRSPTGLRRLRCRRRIILRHRKPPATQPATTEKPQIQPPKQWETWGWAPRAWRYVKWLLIVLAIGGALGAAAAILVISGVASTLQIEIIHRFKIEPRKIDQPKPPKSPWEPKIERAK